MLTSGDLIDLQQGREMARNGVAKMAREAAGLSLREMAEPLGTSPSTILRWERAERRPTGQKGAAYGRQVKFLISGRRA